MSVVDVVSAPASAIGRYFSVLSVVPSSLFTAYAYALLAAAPWSGHPHWTRAAEAFSGLGLGGVAALGLVSLLVGLALQPLQYSLVQFCEGYWGTSAPAQPLMTRRVLHHRRTRTALLDQEGDALRKLQDADQSPLDADADRVDDAHLPALNRYGEATRLLDQYPDNQNDIRPTRLGNVLRRHEAVAGEPYRLPGVTVTPHLALVAPTADVEYLDDRRTQMDLAVRLAVLSALATGLTAVALARAGLWLLLALVPYGGTYLFYRGAVGLAQGYGTALKILIDLNRFALYDRLRMEPPASLQAEREMNKRLAAVLRDQSDEDLPLTVKAWDPPQTGP